MITFNPQQKILFSAEYLLDVNPLKKYELLFDYLNGSPIEKPLSEGRPPISKSGLLRSLIYKNLKLCPPFMTLPSIWSITQASALNVALPRSISLSFSRKTFLFPQRYPQ
jgi:hypothetical protein